TASTRPFWLRKHIDRQNGSGSTCAANMNAAKPCPCRHRRYRAGCHESRSGHLRSRDGGGNDGRDRWRRTAARSPRPMAASIPDKEATMDPRTHKEGNAQNEVPSPTRRSPKVLARIGTSSLVLVASVMLAAGITARPARAAVPNPTVTGPITAACSPNCPSPPGPVNGIHIPDPFDGAGNLQEFIAAGYTEEQFFYEGTATPFGPGPTAPPRNAAGLRPR